MTFINADHPMLLYSFQFLFPFLTTILIVVYVICSRPKDSFESINTISTTAAHAVLSFVFIVFVFALDIFAVIVRNETPEYYSEMYDKPLFDYPGVLLFWDILGLCTIAAVVCTWHCNFLLTLVEVGMVPLLCFASHAHYILIAWITDPFYATSVGIYYGICYIIHLLLFKRIFKEVYYLTNNRNKDLTNNRNKDLTNNHNEDLTNNHNKDLTNNRYCKVRCVQSHPLLWAFVAAVGVFFIVLSYQILITVFIVFLPINNAIENTPSRIFIAIQSAGALLLGFLAYQIIVGKESLSIIIGAIRKVIKMQPTFYTGSTEWKMLENEEKFAKVLQHVFKTNVGSDGTSSPTTTPGTTTSTTTSSLSTS